jgi:ABC-2 type transport system permease protein
MSRAELVIYQARLEQRAFWRNPDYAFFTFALPVVLLVALGATRTGSTLPGNVPEVRVFVPRILAFGIIVAAYANLAQRIAVLRNDGVLKRVRTTPLPPGTYLSGQLVSNLITTLLVALATIVIGDVVFGVAPGLEGLAPLVATLSIGILCFAALALAVSTVISSADAAGPIANATYLPLAIVSGLFDPSLGLPGWLSRVVELFPVKALADALYASYDPGAGFPLGDLAVLAVWAVAGVVLAHRFFRWEP